MGMIIAITLGMLGTLHDSPLSSIELGKPGVTGHIGIDFGQIDPIDQRECLLINLRAADDERFFVVA